MPRTALLKVREKITPCFRETGITYYALHANVPPYKKMWRGREIDVYPTTKKTELGYIEMVGVNGEVF